MNAYELADEIDKYWEIWKQSIPMFDNATNMLRQQANRIAELEKAFSAVYKEYKEYCQKTKPLSDVLAIIDEFRGDKELVFKAYEDTYLDGWLDACNQIYWAIEERHGIK